MRADAHDGLWRNERAAGRADNTQQTPAFRMPRTLRFDAATTAARKLLEEQEEARTANQLRQPDISQAESEWDDVR